MAQANSMHIHSEVAGWYRITATRPGGESRVLADWFPNLITNGGLDRMAVNSSYLTHCQLGTGTATPTVADTALQARVAGTATVISTTSGAQPTPPYYARVTNTYRFAEGVAAGNLSEVSVGWATTGSIFSRARILDSGGNPTTITILSDESVDVTYELRYYPKLTDSTGTVVATGNLGGTYGYTVRAANVTSNSSDTGWNITSLGVAQNNTGSRLAYSGAVGDVTGSPAGLTAGGIPGPVTATYVNGSYTLDLTFTAGLTSSNLAGGIGAFRFKVGIGAYQVGFSPSIPKTASDILTITFRLTWARKAL